ncbi:hypothetical protein ACFXKC_37155 [Streptomyces sp. NPDC059340]|uniref:hypothetical protein n=1 Tax=Streptomyces sp. NPDC059340 TaxID=3346806 RepID=UPI0036BFE936
MPRGLLRSAGAAGLVVGLVVGLVMGLVVGLVVAAPAVAVDRRHTGGATPLTFEGAVSS